MSNPRGSITWNRFLIATCSALAAATAASAGPLGAIGDVYVSNSAGGIHQYDGATGDFVGVFADVPGVTFFMGHDWGPDGNLYAAGVRSFGDWEIFRFDGNTGALIDSVVTGPQGFSMGKGVAFGPDGDLYVGDWADHRIDRYAAGSFTLSASLHANGVIGTPNGMTVGPDGNLLIVSGGWNQVVEVSTAGGGLSLDGVFAGPYSAAQAQDLAFGPDGNLYVTGGNNGGVMRFDGVSGTFIDWFVPESETTPPAGNNGMIFDYHGRLLVSTNVSGGPTVLAYDALTGDLLGDFFPSGSGNMGTPGFISIKPIPSPSSVAALLLGCAVGAGRRRRGG